MKKIKILEKPATRRRDEFLAAVRKSKKLHGRWVAPPRTAEAFDAYLKRLKKKAYLGYWVLADTGAIAGVINISEIVWGGFCSGYLGYYVFAPHNGRGYMKRGMAAVLSDAFRVQGLHRLEANIQPGNESSRALVHRLGFRLEGISPKYLKIAGRWRDHERWAITADELRPPSRSPAKKDKPYVPPPDHPSRRTFLSGKKEDNSTLR